MKRFWLLLCLCFPLILPFPAQAQTQPTFQTDFPPGVLQQWTQVHNQQYGAPSPCRGPNGDTVWQETPTGLAVDIVQSVPCRMVLQPNGLSHNSDEISLHTTWHYSGHRQDQNILISWVDSQNFLSLHLFNNEAHLEYVLNGELLTRAYKTSISLIPNTEYQARIDFSWKTGQFKFWVNHVLMLETIMKADDQLPIKPGIMASVGASSQSSYVRWKSFTVYESIPPVELPGWKQLDAAWSDQTYDSANQWSTEASTIARWGCALTSAANVMEHYGITRLPNGQELNPGTLNAWLKEEPDGFLGPGLLNWRALTRLAAWHNSQFNTPELEFSVHKPEEVLKVSWLKQQLQRLRPVILEQPGHFVTAFQEDTDGKIKIHDPGYPTETLADYNNTYLSARLFTPSFTNLQGGILLTPPWAELGLVNQNSQTVPLEPLEQLWDSPDYQGWKAWNIPRWGAGPLQISMSGVTSTPILGWLYDENGERTSIDTILKHATPVLLQPGQSPPPPAKLTDSDFAIWLSWQVIQSPVVWEWHREVETSLQQSPTSQHQAIRQQYHWLLKQASEKGWIRAAYIPTLLSDLE